MAAHSRKSAADGEAPSVRDEAKEFGLGRAGVISLAPAGHNCSFFKRARFLHPQFPALLHSLLTDSAQPVTSPVLFQRCARRVHLTSS